MKLFKTALISVVVVLLVAVCSMTVVLAFRIWDPLWNPFRPSPLEVLAKTAEKMQQLNSFSYGISADLQGGENDTISSFSLAAEGNAENDKSSAIFDLSLGIRGILLNFGIEYKALEEESYYKITKIPDIPNLPQDLQLQKDKWIKQEKGTDGFQLNSIRSIFKNKDLYILEKQLKDEYVSGQPVYHYVLKLNKEKVEKILDQYANTAENGSDVFSSALVTLPKALEDADINVLIGKKDYYIYKVNIKADTADAEIALSDFNKSFNIQAPQDYGN
jgi:hypothetical protein